MRTRGQDLLMRISRNRSRSVAAQAPWAIGRARGAAASPAAPSTLTLLTDPINQVDQVEHLVGIQKTVFHGWRAEISIEDHGRSP